MAHFKDILNKAGEASDDPVSMLIAAGKEQRSIYVQAAGGAGGRRNQTSGKFQLFFSLPNHIRPCPCVVSQSYIYLVRKITCWSFSFNIFQN